MKAKTPLEAQEQTALFVWVAKNYGQMPELGLLYHIPNGGYRNAAEGANLKRQGVKAGIPDLFLPVPRGGYHGLYIELKRRGCEKNKNNGLSDKQLAVIEYLAEQGYAVFVCYGWQDAATVITEYLEGK